MAWDRKECVFGYSLRPAYRIASLGFGHERKLALGAATELCPYLVRGNSSMKEGSFFCFRYPEAAGRQMTGSRVESPVWRRRCHHPPVEQARAEGMISLRLGSAGRGCYRAPSALRPDRHDGAK